MYWLTNSLYQTRGTQWMEFVDYYRVLLFEYWSFISDNFKYIFKRSLMNAPSMSNWRYLIKDLCTRWNHQWHSLWKAFTKCVLNYDLSYFNPQSMLHNNVIISPTQNLSKADLYRMHWKPLRLYDENKMCCCILIYHVLTSATLCTWAWGESVPTIRPMLSAQLIKLNGLSNMGHWGIRFGSPHCEHKTVKLLTLKVPNFCKFT